MPEHRTPSRLCCGLLDACRCLAATGIFICLDLLWAIIAVGAVAGTGFALGCAGTGACDGLDDYESELQNAQTGMLIAAIIAFIRLCVDIFGCQAVKNYNATNTGYYWKITLLFAFLGLIGPIMSAASEAGGGSTCPGNRSSTAQSLVGARDKGCSHTA